MRMRTILHRFTAAASSSGCAAGRPVSAPSARSPGRRTPRRPGLGLVARAAQAEGRRQCPAAGRRDGAALGGSLGSRRRGEAATRGRRQSERRERARSDAAGAGRQNGSAANGPAAAREGANPNAPNLAGETPLMTAAETGNLDVVKAMLAQGGDPNVKERTQDQTALMWAASEKHAAITQALIKAGRRRPRAIERRLDAVAVRGAKRRHRKRPPIARRRRRRQRAQCSTAALALIVAAGSGHGELGMSAARARGRSERGHRGSTESPRCTR